MNLYREIVWLTLEEAFAAIVTTAELMDEQVNRGQDYQVLAPAADILLHPYHRAYQKLAWPAVMMHPGTNSAKPARNQRELT